MTKITVSVDDFICQKKNILNSSQVHNLNDEFNNPDMNISLKNNLVDEWVSANLLPIMSYRNSAMVIMQGCPIWLKVLSALGFTVDTVYYH